MRSRSTQIVPNGVRLPCGYLYLVAAWAVAAHKLGAAFDTLTLDVARSFNPRTREARSGGGREPGVRVSIECRVA